MPLLPIDGLYLEIGKKIGEHRAQKSISQAALARLIGCSRPTIVNVEQGKQKATLELVVRVADGLGLSYLDLLPTPEEVLHKQEIVHSAQIVDEKEMIKNLKVKIGISNT